MKGHTELPWRVGRTGEEQIMLLGANDRYTCNIQIYQTPRQFGLQDEAERKANAALILTAVNTYPAVSELVEALEACQASLALMIEPKAISSSSVMGAFTQAFEADCKARSALTHYRELAGTSNEGAK